LELLARGDLTEEIELRGEMDVTGRALRAVQGSLRDLLESTQALAVAATEGQLSRRADHGALQGAYGALVDRVNGLLDAVVRPVNEATAALERLAARDLTVRVNGDYSGDHAR